MKTPEKDFAYELSLSDFSYKKIVVDNEDFKQALFEEFCSLPPRPKLHWYINDFISDEEYAQSRLKNPTHEDFDSFISRLMAEFEEKCLNADVEEKYYGRSIKETNTVKLLTEISNKILGFKSYVFTGSNADYYNFAKATCEKIIALANKINITGLKHSLLTHIIDDEENIQISFECINDDNSSRKNLLVKNYRNLKVFADAILMAEIEKFTNTEHSSLKRKIRPTKTFEDYFIEEHKKLPQLLKEEFKTEKGMSLSVLIKVLKTREIVLIGSREMKAFINAMSTYFDRDLGTYQSINDSKVSKETHAEEYMIVNTKIDLLIGQIKPNKA